MHTYTIPDMDYRRETHTDCKKKKRYDNHGHIALSIRRLVVHEIESYGYVGDNQHHTVVSMTRLVLKGMVEGP